MRDYRTLLLFSIAMLVSSCATMMEGPVSRVKYEGGPGKLAFYNDSGRQIPSSYRFDDHSQTHLNYIELDKRIQRHVITARYENQLQTDTLDREFNYLWLVPNALFVYPFPLFAGIDVLSRSIYTFPDRRVKLVQKDPTGLPQPEPLEHLTIVPSDPPATALIRAHVGLLMPIESELTGLHSFGGQAGYHVGSGVWIVGGYDYGDQLRQRLGSFSRSYRTTVHALEGGVQFEPVDFFYLVSVLAYDHMIFERTFGREGEERRRFGRNLVTCKLGFGLQFSGAFLEYRRVLGLVRIETPEGPGHAIAYNNLRFGAMLRL